MQGSDGVTPPLAAGMDDGCRQVDEAGCSGHGGMPSPPTTPEVQANKALETRKLSWDSDLNIIFVQLSAKKIQKDIRALT
ncbi:hypothetical protein BRADI_41430s00100v3 [Brachypodium distachyon]|uniref:Uncharacterized protein n=1 Tax=Brachypodium distachyon TaxID=15368 RepID=A0A2K1RAF0_BRADI|nr:hypothetical protein BRADI_41430s00100v3 [Brachypodium distachyon]